MIQITPQMRILLAVDGTVVAVGSNHYGQCNVIDWNLISVVFTGVPPGY